MRRFAKLMVVLSLAAGGCMQSRPTSNLACAYRAIPMAVNDGQVPPPVAQTPITTNDIFGTELEKVIEKRATPAPAPAAQTAGKVAVGAPSAPPNFLVLSGGSQHGAFGAGFFRGLKSVPTFDMVTGVSTGSLQSSLLFLANQPVPKDRTYGWVDGPLASEIKPGTSNVGDLALAFSIDKEGDIATPTGGGILGGLSQGALATFGPLEARLKAIISPDTLRAIRAERDKGRALFVGVVNLDDGKAYAIDLTELASRVDLPAWAGKTSDLQDCYVKALVASSSVTPSAYPVSLTIQDGNSTRTNMYMDGGARFGVFLDQILRSLGQSVHKDSKVTLIVNGVLYATPWTSGGKPVDKWSSLTVTARAVQLLETQVYNFSVASAENFGTSHGGLDMAFISTEGLAPGAVQPDQFVFRGKTCAEWTTVDNEKKPLEFHPNYMACLSEYGRSRGAAGAWNRQVAKPAGAL